jgi:hypothetical protein
MERRVPDRGTTVTAVFVDDARGWARRLEDAEAARRHVPVEDARPIVARKLGIAPGTLTSLRKNRLKDISAAVYAKLNQAVEGLLARELAALEHELHVVKSKGFSAGEGDLAAVAEDIARVRAALGLTATPSDGGS